MQNNTKLLLIVLTACSFTVLFSSNLAFATTLPDTTMSKVKTDVPISKYHGIDRNHVYFDAYKKGQELLAKQIFDSSKTQKKKTVSSTIEYEYYGRLHDSIQNMAKAQFEFALKKASRS